MTTSPLIIPVARFFSVSGGAALAGGKVYTYAAGTSTPKASYTDYSGTTPNANPVILDSAGQANIWLDGNYKINLTDSNDVQISGYPVDNVSSISTGSASEYAVTTGSANTYILTPSPAIVAYATGATFKIKVNATNTGPTTINISSLGAKSVVINGSTALTGGELLTGVIYIIVYDGTNFQLIGGIYPNTSGYVYTSNGTSSAPSFQLFNLTHGADVASASTLNLDTATGQVVDVTGTTTITAITLSNGRQRDVRFTGALTLTNGASLVLPGGANITTAAGDCAVFQGYGSGVVRCLNYTKADGTAFTTTAAAMRTAIGVVTATTSGEGLVKLATNAEVTTGTDTSRVSPVSSMVYHEGVIKAWVKFTLTGSIDDSYNVTSVTDNSTSLKTINFTTAFANSNYVAVVTQKQSATASYTPNMCIGAQTTTTCELFNSDETTNVTGWLMIFIGDR